MVERDGELVAFLVGFLCPTHADEAYIHFVGVDRSHRGRGVARDLYERFFELARADGRRVVRAVTAPLNTGSVEFHRRLGFRVVPGNGSVDGIPVWLDHDGAEEHRLRLERELGSPAAP